MSSEAGEADLKSDTKRISGGLKRGGLTWIICSITRNLCHVIYRFRACDEYDDDMQQQY